MYQNGFTVLQFYDCFILRFYDLTFFYNIVAWSVYEVTLNYVSHTKQSNVLLRKN